ncbi:hypothetical protein HDU96_008988 [Phlyctochytrium bullatum]|nr:hypothetical protein HDU96_008988 [Phlyctochytrium bullatum]
MTTTTTRRLILAALDWTRPKDPPVSLGAASIAATLRHSHIDVALQAWAVNHPRFNPADVIQWTLHNACNDPRADFGVGLFVWNDKDARDVMRGLRDAGFAGRIIVGGPQVTYAGPGVERFYPDADVFVRGNAEKAVLALMIDGERRPSQRISGTHFRGELDLARPATTTLDDLPSPLLTGILPPQPFLRWETQRGCPFRCAFCQHRQPGVDAARRLPLSLPRIHAEIDWLTRHPVVRDVAVLDPVFNSGPAHLGVLHALADAGFGGKLSLQARPEMVTPAFLDAVERLQTTAGARPVLEFGLQTIHRDEQRVIERPNNLVRTDAVLRQCMERGIAVEVSLIFGLPGQTLASFRESVEWCRERVPVGRSGCAVKAFPLMLLRGTPLHERREELGLVESMEVEEELEGVGRQTTHIPHVVESPTFTRKEWGQMAALAAELCKS